MGKKELMDKAQPLAEKSFTIVSLPFITKVDFDYYFYIFGLDFAETDAMELFTGYYLLSYNRGNSTSTQTYINLNKLSPAYITSTARSRHSPTHLSLFTATLLLCGDIQPNPGPTHPANLLICTLNTRSMLTLNTLPHSTT